MAPVPFVLIDGMNSAYRAYWSHTDLKDSAGRDTGLIYGMLREIMMLRETCKSTHLILCWDRMSWRRTTSTVYKAGRVVDPTVSDSIREQTHTLSEFLSSIGIPSISCEGLEADDLISLTTFNVPEGTPIYIYSSDKDFYQLLVNSDVRVIKPHPLKRGLLTVTAPDAEKAHGVPVKLWSHYLAAGGDTSDGYKPFPGVGPKIAARLVLQGLRANAPYSEQPPTVQAALAKHVDRWCLLNDAYQFARLPRTFTSRFLPPTLRAPAAEAVSAITHHQWHYDSNRVRLVERFLSDYEMPSLLVKRRLLTNDPQYRD